MGSKIAKKIELNDLGNQCRYPVRRSFKDRMCTGYRPLGTHWFRRSFREPVPPFALVDGGEHWIPHWFPIRSLPYPGSRGRP